MDLNHAIKRVSPTRDHFSEQTSELLYAVFYTLLAKEGRFLNGFSQGKIDLKFKCLGSEKVYQSFFGACTEFLLLHGDELRDSIDTLDMSDVKVDDTFHQLILSIFEEINWGRIVSAVCASKVMATRAAKEGRVTLVESLHAWLQTIFSTRVQDWVKEQGGWVEFPDRFNPDRNVVVHKVGKKKNDSSLLALAAAGLGVLVVTSILGR